MLPARRSVNSTRLGALLRQCIRHVLRLRQGSAPKTCILHMTGSSASRRHRLAPSPGHTQKDLPPPSGSLRTARLEIERLMSARHAVLSQGAKQVPPHFLAWPETFGRTDSKRCRRSREINDFHLPPAQTPRTRFRDHYGISEIRRHPSSFDADV